MQASSNPPHQDQLGIRAGFAASRRDFIAAQLDNHAFFEDLIKHPEAGARHRLPRLRSARAAFVEWRCFQLQERLDQWKLKAKEALSSGNPDCINKVHDEYEKLIMDIDRYVTWSTRCYVEDSKMARAPIIPEYFLNWVLRYNLRGSPGDRAPNGLPKTAYGSPGDDICDDFATICDVEESLFGSFLIKRVFNPLYKQVYAPLGRRYAAWRGREAPDSSAEIGEKLLDASASFFEILVGAALIAGSVILVYNLTQMRNKMIAAAFSTLGFTLAGFFLSKRAAITFTLIAAYWAVVIGLISTASCAHQGSFTPKV